MSASQAGPEAVDAILARLFALHPKRIDLSLGRIERLLAALDHPERRLPPVIHVAGTNGKGSTIAFMRAVLETAGKNVHVYTSPNLVRINERFRLGKPGGGKLVSDAELAREGLERFVLIATPENRQRCPDELLLQQRYRPHDVLVPLGPCQTTASDESERLARARRFVGSGTLEQLDINSHRRYYNLARLQSRDRTKQLFSKVFRHHNSKPCTAPLLPLPRLHLRYDHDEHF